MYDADGNRIVRIADTSDSSLNTYYVGSGVEVTDPHDTSPDTVTHYSFGAITVGFRTDDGTTETRYYLATDHLGTSGAHYEQTNPTGTITHQYHLPYGGLRGATTNALATDHTYTGQIDDSALGTGLMFYNARYYDPTLRRFISADTIVPNPAESQDHNRYMYVRGNPVRYSDPTGHEVSCSDYCVVLGSNTRDPRYRTRPAQSRRQITMDFIELSGVEVVGQLIFQDWIDGSGRLDLERGSEWWLAANGAMIEDMRLATEAINDGRTSREVADPRVRNWVEYAEAAQLGADGDTTQRLYWRAHQVSLHAGIDEAAYLLGLESPSERAFITRVVENVDASALVNFESHGLGAAGMLIFLDREYPHSYPAPAGAGTSIAPLLLRVGDEGFERYRTLVGGNLIGTTSVYPWQDLGP